MIYTIPKKMSGSGSIHDAASDTQDRRIDFCNGGKFAVVLASYYGGKGYTTHRTAEAAASASKASKHYSHTIIDASGVEYRIKPGYWDDTLVAA